MARYLSITLAVEVEVEDAISDEDTIATADTVCGVVRTAIPDAIDVSVEAYTLSPYTPPNEPDSPSPGQGYGWVPGVGWRKRK